MSSLHADNDANIWKGPVNIDVPTPYETGGEHDMIGRRIDWSALFYETSK